MNEFIKEISRGLTDESFEAREKANLALLAYDFGRAKSQSDRDRAGREYNFRMMAFCSQAGLKEAMRWSRK